jgi:hypothetical protein
MKEVVINVRLPEEEKRLFAELCKSNDTTVSREIRSFIRGKLKEQAQLSLLKSA